MDPIVYAALPPDKKKEYIDRFPEPTLDPISERDIDGRLLLGFALFYRTQQKTENVRYGVDDK